MPNFLNTLLDCIPELDPDKYPPYDLGDEVKIQCIRDCQKHANRLEASYEKWGEYYDSKVVYNNFEQGILTVKFCKVTRRF